MRREQPFGLIVTFCPLVKVLEVSPVAAETGEVANCVNKTAERIAKISFIDLLMS
jgi:hypothetical protein